MLRTIVSVCLCLVNLLLPSLTRADETACQDKLVRILKLRSQETDLTGMRLPLAELERRLEFWQPGVIGPGGIVAGPDRWLSGTRLLPAEARVAVVHLFASWCKPCEKELPLLFELWREIAESRDIAQRKGVAFVMIAEADSPQGLSQLRQRYPLLGRELPLFADGASSLLTLLGSGSSDGQPEIPSTFLVDRCGLVRHVFVGSLVGRRTAFLAALQRMWSSTGGLVCSPGSDRMPPQ